MSEIAMPMPVLNALDITGHIDEDGYAVVENFVNPAELQKAQEFVRQAVEKNGGEYVGFNGGKDLTGTFLEKIAEDPRLTELCQAIYTQATGASAPTVEFYQILRCLSGEQARLHSWRFHYDSYVLTLLIPITMPSHGSRGNLIILPKLRRIRSSYGLNLLDKLLVDNRLSQIVFREAYKRHIGKMISLELKPGNLYFFWGYRSLHTNEPCDADEIRATALLHYADPHADSGLKRAIRARGTGRSGEAAT